MEFWGAEVKSGEPVKVTVGDGMVLHLSQACLGELIKEQGNESACLFVNVEGKKFVIGTLCTEKFPQQQFDLVFDRDFELSHNWKSGSVYFCSYKSSNHSGEFDATEGPRGALDKSKSEEGISPTVANNGKPETKAKQEKPADAQKPKAGNGKQKIEIGTMGIHFRGSNEDSMSDGSDSYSDPDSEDESDSKFDVTEAEPVKDSSDDESDESEEETPEKSETGKKRKLEPAAETPVQVKKAKGTSQKAENDKKGGGHVATPHPAKQTGKTLAGKPNHKSTKSGGSSHSCKTCNRKFGTEKALESHTKAKHE